ncbi:FHA domain-containing protein, partial [Myxococcota bacterium]
IAIRVLEGEHGGPEARLIDLNTGQGFHIEGAGVFEGAQVWGPAFIRIGSYAVMLFPRGNDPDIWPDHPEGLFDTLVHARVVGPQGGGPKQKAACLVRDEERMGTVITKIGAPALPRRHRTADGPLPDDAWAVLTMSGGSRHALFPLTEKQLERGVLLGRYDRCEVETIGLWANEMVSRVHLLLLKEGETVLAIDTASSNGTFINGAPFDVVVLPDDAILELAQANMVRWHVVGESDMALVPRLELVPDPEPERDVQAEPEPESPKSEQAPPSPAPLIVLPPPKEAPRHKARPVRQAKPGAWRPQVMWWAMLIAGSVVTMIIDALRDRPDQEPPEVRQCIHPIRDFGTDSPALRLYLQHQNPDMCFEYKWTPAVQEDLEEQLQDWSE